MLTPDHPGLNWFPQDLRNPGAALSDRPVGQGVCRDATSAQEVGLGPPGNSGDAGGQRSAPNQPPPQLLSQSCLSVPPQAGGQSWPSRHVPFCFSKTRCVEECSCFSCLSLCPTLPLELFPCPLRLPQPPTQSAPAWCPGTPGGWGTLECAMPEVRAQV